MKAALTRLAEAAGLAPAEPRSVVLAGKATRLRERAVLAEDRCNGLRSELAAARKAADAEAIEEVVRGPATLEAERLEAALRERETERESLVRLAEGLEAASKRAAVEERLEAEERRVRALSDDYGQRCEALKEPLARVLLALGAVRVVEARYLDAVERFVKGGGAPPGTRGLRVENIVRAAEARACEIATEAAFDNPPARVVPVRVPLVDVEDVRS